MSPLQVHAQSQCLSLFKLSKAGTEPTKYYAATTQQYIICDSWVNNRIPLTPRGPQANVWENRRENNGAWEGE